MVRPKNTQCRKESRSISSCSEVNNRTCQRHLSNPGVRVRLAEWEEGYRPRGQPQASPMEVPSPGEIGQAGFQFPKPKEEEFQGPPELGVDTQIHPVSDLPNPAVSHPASSAVINHTHQSPTGTPYHGGSQRNHFSASPTQGVPEHDRGAPGFLCLPVAHLVFWLHML